MTSAPPPPQQTPPPSPHAAALPPPPHPHPHPHPHPETSPPASAPPPPPTSPPDARTPITSAAGDRPSPIDPYLEALVASRGTDLHLSVGLGPRMRVAGRLVAMPGTVALTPDDLDRLLRDLLSPEQYRAATSGDVDFSFGWRRAARVRGNVYRQRGTHALALRLMPRRIPDFDELRLPPAVREFAKARRGFVLVTGPTGAGKSTTLAAIVAEIARTRSDHIITIEDPIEYIHEHSASVVHQRAVGQDTPSFADALRSALREDPDVLLVGELRDLTSVRLAVTMAETGHLVLATAHANDTCQAVDRLIDVFPGDEQPLIRMQLAMGLTGVVHQRLVPRKGGGVVGAFEVLLMNAALRNLVKQGRTGQMRNQLLTGGSDGMITLEQSLAGLVNSGWISLDDALANSGHPDELLTVMGQG